MRVCFYFLQKNMKLATKAIHLWQQPDPTTGSIIPPLYLTSTYVQEKPGLHKWYEYTRSGNPNFTNVEATLAGLEGGDYALLFSSGLWATTTIILWLLQAWDKVIAIDDMYGGTFRLLNNVFAKYGIIFEQIDMDNEILLENKLQEKAVKLLWIESPTNPLLKQTDLTRVLTLTQKHHVIGVVDNTFATPYFQQPLAVWADIVLHSTTKYLGGHSDVIGGAIVTNNKEYFSQLSYHRNAAGINPSPFDARLLSRSLKTLAVRMKQHDENAKHIVSLLENHPLIKQLYYPWFGGMISVELTLSLQDTMDFISNLTLFRLAESLWWVESLIEHPASMTHASIPETIRQAQWLSNGLIRVSVGVEDKEDLAQDIITWLKKYH